jgi:hypothetical protein
LLDPARPGIDINPNRLDTTRIDPSSRSGLPLPRRKWLAPHGSTGTYFPARSPTNDSSITQSIPPI